MGRLVSITVFCLFAIGAGRVFAQQAAAPAALGPLGVPLGATGGLNDAPDIFAKNCAGCHGNNLAGGRGPSLFAQGLLAETSDDLLRHTILSGVAGSDMPSFQGKLDDAQIGRLLAFFRIRGGALADHPPSVPDPANKLIK